MASDKGVIPATDHAEKTRKDIKQQCRPDLPTDRVCAVAQEIAQLQALLDLSKEDFDLPAAAIQISDTAGAPLGAEERRALRKRHYSNRAGCPVTAKTAFHLGHPGRFAFSEAPASQ